MKDGWEVRPLGEVAEVIAGQSPPGSAYNKAGDGLPFYQGKKDFAERYLSPPAVWTTHVTKRAEPGDILMSVRAPVGPINEAVEPICIGRGLAAIRANGAFVDDYLWYGLLALQPDIVGTDGAVFASINRSQIAALPIPLPPLEEQRRIVAVLDEAFDGLARARVNIEANLADAQEVFEKAAGVTFSFQEEMAEITSVAGLAARHKGSIRTGPFGSDLLHGEFVDEGIAVLGIDNAVKNEFAWGKRRFITPGKYQDLRRYTVKPGDVVITIMGTCGRSAVIPDDIGTAINSKHLCCITVDQSRCEPHYLHGFFLFSNSSKEYLGKSASGSVMDGLNMKLIKAMPVALPSIGEQRKAVMQLRELAEGKDRATGAYTAQLADLATLRKSFLARAFRGELT